MFVDISKVMLYRFNLRLAHFQVRRLAMEVRQLASSKQITVLNGNSTQGQYILFV